MLGLEGWPKQVFVLMGGFIAGTGVRTVFLAWVAMPAAIERRAIVLTAALTVTLMSATKFGLNSEFRRMLLVPVLVWLVGLVLYVSGNSSHCD